MAEPTRIASQGTEQLTTSNLMKVLLLPVVVGVVCAGMGFAIPLAFPAVVDGKKTELPTPYSESRFIKFGDVVVNLNEVRMSRYLRFGITLQLSANVKDGPELVALLEK